MGDMIGEVRGRLTVLEYAGKNKHKNKQWLCRCECGNEKVITTSNLNYGKTKSCGCLKSEFIHDKHKNALIGKHFERLKVVSLHSNMDNKMYWNCECTCGHTTVVTTGALQAGSVRSCGCLQVDMVSGKNHWKWKGGITPENHKVRTSQAYKVWRLDVFERDGFTCQKCGDNGGGTLNAHHILSFANHKEARLKVSNGITLCKQCHTKFHSTYTKTNFTEDDYLEFIGEVE